MTTKKKTLDELIEKKNKEIKELIHTPKTAEEIQEECQKIANQCMRDIIDTGFDGEINFCLDPRKNRQEVKEVVKDTGDGIDDQILELVREFSEKVYKTGFKGSISVKTQKDPTQFCSHCGAGMIEKDVFEDAFDTRTGKKLYIKQFTCPKRKGLFGHRHDCRYVGAPFTK